MHVEATAKRTSGFECDRKGRISANAFSITKIESSTPCTCNTTLCPLNKSIFGNYLVTKKKRRNEKENRKPLRCLDVRFIVVE